VRAFADYGADPACAPDEARVLRLVPYPNRKLSPAGVPSALVMESGTKYDLAALLDAFAPPAATRVHDIPGPAPPFAPPPEAKSAGEEREEGPTAEDLTAERMEELVENTSPVRHVVVRSGLDAVDHHACMWLLRAAPIRSVGDGARQQIQQDIDADEVDRHGRVGHGHEGDAPEPLASHRTADLVRQPTDLVDPRTKRLIAEVRRGAHVEYIWIHPDPHLRGPTRMLRPDRNLVRKGFRPFLKTAPSRPDNVAERVDMLALDALLDGAFKRSAIIARPAQPNQAVLRRIDPR
jgi:hypothetical protein